MITTQLRSFARPKAPWVAFGCAALLFSLLPPGIALMNDDFGYLGSVVETLRHHRPWTDEWLEPWSASLAVASALVFKLTGSVEASVFGIQALAAGATGAAVYTLLVSRGMRARAATLVTVLALTFPTVLWKSLEYTGMVIYMPALLWVVWSAEHKRWRLFLVVWLLALATRQSAVVWLLIPVGAVATCLWHPSAPHPDRMAVAIVAACGILAFLALDVFMNKTHAQAMVTDRLWEGIHPAAFLHHAAFGIGIWFVFVGLGALIQAATTGSLPSGDSPRRVSVVVAGACIFTLLSLLPPIYFEHASFGGIQGLVFRNLVITAGLTGWALFRFSLRYDFLVAAAGSLLVLCLKKDVWDYYYYDVGVLAIFGIRRPASPSPVTVSARWFAPAATALSIVFAGFHCYGAFLQKCRVDRDYATCVLTERALRRDAIGLTETAHAPFGFIGWHLHRYYIAHEGRQDPEIGGFMRYLRPGTIDVRSSPMRLWEQSRSLRPIEGPDQARVVNSDVFRIAWLWHQRCSLLRTRNRAAEAAALAAGSPSPLIRRFPLNSDEWSRCLAGQSY